jgi:TnpA family transposase
MLIAAVMALGTNHGLGRLARSTPFSYRQLAWATDWHIREDTIRAALIELDQFVLRHPLARYWGDGTRSSSDGMRVRVAVNAANADRNAQRAQQPASRLVTRTSQISRGPKRLFLLFTPTMSRRRSARGA